MKSKAIFYPENLKLERRRKKRAVVEGVTSGVRYSLALFFVVLSFSIFLSIVR